MKVVWVLLVFIEATNGPAFSTHEFRTEAACHQAVDWTRANVRAWKGRSFAICIPDQRGGDK